MEIPIGMLALLGVTVVTVIAFLIYNSDKQISTKTTIMNCSPSTYEQEREARAWQFQNEIDAMTTASMVNYILMPSSGSTVTPQHAQYPETIKTSSQHCQFCGNKFVADKFGRCSSCGGPAK